MNENPAEQLLKENPVLAIEGVEKLYRKLRSMGITRDQLRKALKKSELHQITDSKRNLSYIPIIAKEPYTYQVDLSFFENYKVPNDGVIGLLNIVEITSRKAFSYPIESKTEKEISEKLKDFISKNKVNTIQSDNGTEFNNKTVQQLSKDFKFNWVFSQPGEKTFTGKVERFNRTIRDLISKWFLLTGKKNYVKILPDLINNYNSSYHKSIGMAPDDFDMEKDFDRYNAEVRQSDRFDRALVDFNKFQVGDRVRHIENKSLFSKGSSKYSDQIYTITAKVGWKFILTNDQNQTLGRKYKHWELKKVSSPISTLPKENQTEKELIEDVKTIKKIKRNAKIDVSLEELRRNKKN